MTEKEILDRFPAHRLAGALRVKQEEKVNFPLLVDTPDNTVRNAYRGWANGIFVVNMDGVLVFKSSWTHGPELAQVLHDLHAWEKAQGQHELFGLRRNEKIRASVNRHAGPQAAQDFARLLEAEGKLASRAA